MKKGESAIELILIFFMQSVLSCESICIINPRDEMPHDEKGHKVHYQHGNVRITEDETSVGFVFRVSPHVCMCNVSTNTVILDKATMESIEVRELTGRVNVEQRQKQYDNLDIKSYHDKIRARFKNILK